MDRQTYALLGRWHDIVGQHHGGGGRGWGGSRGRWGHDRRGWGGWGWGGWGGYPGYGVDQGDGGYDPAVWMAYLQQLQLQQPQMQMQMPMPAPQAPAGPPAPGGAPAPGVSGWYDITGPSVGQMPGGGDLPFPPPRAAVVDAPLPTQANRDILPMSTGVPILPTQSAQITGRPQTLVFKIGRFVISNAGTAGGAADWIVNDIKIGNRSQFVQSGDVPGDLFATNAIDTFVRFESAQTAMDVVVVVTYIGLNESGCPFFGAMVGTAAV
jgi:hypothetical protein